MTSETQRPAASPATTSSIRGKIFMRMLPLVVLPMLLLSFVTFLGVQRLQEDADRTVTETRATVSEEVVSESLRLKAEAVAQDLDLFFTTNLDQVRFVATVPSMVNAATLGGDIARVAGYEGMSVVEMEANAPEGNSLAVDEVADAFLAQQVTETINGVVLTDVHGLTVGASASSADKFANGDETWWISAMDQGFFLGAPDSSSGNGAVVFDVAARIDDPVTGEAVGVLKATLDAAVIGQRIAELNDAADQIAVVLPDSRFIGGATGMEQLSPESVGQTLENARIEELLAEEAGGSGADFSTDFAYGYARLANPQAPWLVVVDRPASLAFAPLSGLDSLSGAIDDSQRNLFLALAIALLGGVLLAVFGAHLVARGVVRPIRRLAEMARRSANETLPATVQAINDLEEGEEPPTLPRIAMHTNDELEGLATAMNTLQTAAADLATGEARAKRARTDLFMNLGRRSQKLAVRQLDHLEDLEQNETEPETLDGLLKVDHLATRMRRNAESLLILANQDSPRRYRQPVPLRDLARAAAAEIADYQRVDFSAFQAGAVRGEVAGDVIHMIAELIENAARFSNPQTSVDVRGEQAGPDYEIAIMDRGVGLSEERISSLNARLADPVLAELESSSYLGIQVISRLAERHDIKVALEESPHNGITAKVLLPATILRDEEAPVRPTPKPKAEEPAADTTKDSSKEASAVADKDEPKTEAAAEEVTASGLKKRKRKSRKEPVTVDAVVAVPDVADGGSSEPPSGGDSERTASGLKRRKKSTNNKVAPSAKKSSMPPKPSATTAEEAATASRSRFGSLQAGVRQGRDELGAKSSESDSKNEETGANDE